MRWDDEKAIYILMMVALFGVISVARQLSKGTDNSGKNSESDKSVLHLIVESHDDIGETAAEFKADLKQAFEAMGRWLNRHRQNLLTFMFT
jgi:hypothetical protein